MLLLHGCVQAAEARELAEARACCAAAEAPPPAHGGNIFMAGGFEARVHGAATAWSQAYMAVAHKALRESIRRPSN